MTSPLAIWGLILVAFVAANVPFLTQRLFGVVALRQPKSMGLRLLELLVLFFVVGGLGRLLEHQMGRIAPQGWEFYAIAGALFLTFAFPGFTWRYLMRHH